MRSVALLPSVALLAGVSTGTWWAQPVPSGGAALVALLALAVAAWMLREGRGVVGALAVAFALAGLLLGADAARTASDPPLRAALDDRFGGFRLDSLGPPGAHDPIPMRARLLEDAVPRDFGVSVRVAIEALSLNGVERPISGDVRVTIAGAAALDRATAWRAGRTIEAPVTFRRPARYLNDGTADSERDQALDGIVLTGSVKSGLLVRVVRQGGAFQELAAVLRARVRRLSARHVENPLAAAIVTAILIGDRTGLPLDVRARLQAAGTYHVIAISGGNIAILAAVVTGALLLGGVAGRPAALVVIAVLLAYSAVASAGPSVWRATATAVAYLSARLLDHRSPPWNAMAVSAAVLACAAPLDVRDVGFALTFGATGAIIEAARRARQGTHPVASWAIASIVASLAAEVVLLPIAASAFSRVTLAGVVLNLAAVPLMTVAQIAGLVVSALGDLAWMGAAAGVVAGAAATGLVESARLVDLLPWLAVRVPAPPPSLIVAYYAALAGALWLPNVAAGRRACAIVAAACGGAIVLGLAPPVERGAPAGRLRVTMFDVGQGEALLLQTAGGRSLMVDSGGVGVDGAAFDVGGRVLAPALWAKGVRTLGALAMTHGDPDHAGGAAAVLGDFEPPEIWEGVPVPRHEPMRLLHAAAARAGARIVRRLAGARVLLDDVEVRVLHPPAPDWERQRVRNDDSLVLEILYGGVALLLTGDIGAEVERTLIPQLTPATIRILKVAHHGSRTSTSAALLDAWKPQIALISCGRGNRFGHPAREVLDRLAAAGVRVYRTDRHGQITVESDGTVAVVRTYMPGTSVTVFSPRSHEGHEGGSRAHRRSQHAAARD